MSSPTQRVIESNGIHLNIAEMGSGPLVILAHGFPESWYSWRHQIDALAQAGFHVVAPAMAAMGTAISLKAIDQNTVFHLAGDMVGVLHALQTPRAVIVGHDWGANVAWQAALMRPDRFRAIVAELSVLGPGHRGGGSHLAVWPLSVPFRSHRDFVTHGPRMDDRDLSRAAWPSGQ